MRWWLSRGGLVLFATTTSTHSLRCVITKSRPLHRVTRMMSSSDMAAVSEGEEWTVSRVRSTFTDYFTEKHGHSIVASSPVVPVNDPTLLFANAGMNQFKPIFLGNAGRDSPLSNLKRATNSQKCIRAGGKHNDLEDVGMDTYHHTFFEMLGTWSFGDYFKEEAIEWAWDLLVNVYGLDPERLYATYFGGEEGGLDADEEARDLWLKYLPEERVLPGSQKDNFWEMGDTGPCGPCSELHYDARGGRGNVRHLVNMDDPEVLEIWNIVFIQYNRAKEKGELESLPARHVDTGMGLERLVAILQGKLSNYDTDAFSGLFRAIHDEVGGDEYGGVLKDRRDTAYRAVSDHVRCLCFALADGAVPSNEGRGYVLRRVLRRAVRYGRQVLGAKDGFMSRLAPAVARDFGDAYPELRSKLPEIVAIVREEEDAFAKTLERGVKYLDDELEELRKQKLDTLSGPAAFFLYDSLGFPVDLTALMAAEQGFSVDEDGFEKEMQRQVKRSRDARDAKRAQDLGGTAAVQLGPSQIAELSADVEPTLSLIYEPPEDTQPAKVLALFSTSPEQGATNGPVRVEESALDATGDVVGVVLDRSPFYPEGGGQVADVGVLSLQQGEETLELNVIDVQAFAGYVVHTCRVGESSSLSGLAALKVGDSATAIVDAERRKRIAPNHSMTHLLNHALRLTLGDGVDQRGSLCDAERLRFDFSHPKAVGADQLVAVEGIVNQVIESDKPVQSDVVPLEKARAVKALKAVFGEAYPDPVRVVAAGSDSPISDMVESPDSEEWAGLSIELCGGTHIAMTSEAEAFVIVEETAVAKGIRRIEAVTRDRAVAARKVGEKLEASIDELSVDDARVEERAKLLRTELDASTCSAALKPRLRAKLEDLGRRVNQRRKEQRAKLVADAADNLVRAAEEVAEDADRLVVDLGPGLDAKAAANMANKLHKTNPSIALLALSKNEDSDTFFVFASVPPDHAFSGQASAFLRAALAPLGGKGGGRDNFAQGSAPSDGDLQAALRAASDFEIAATVA